MSLFSRLRRLAGRWRDRKDRPEETLFREAAAALEPGDVALDCGANVGKFTTVMAESGAQVYAFEPHPVAYRQLEKNTRDLPNVTAIHAAVTDTPGPVKLYLHRWDQEDPVHWSTGSSMIQAKRNVDPERHVEVEGVALGDFIEELDAERIQLLKMDIEGAEVAVLNDLLDRELHRSIDLAFVELHDRQIRELASATRQLRERLRAGGASHFHLDWR